MRHFFFNVCCYPIRNGKVAQSSTNRFVTAIKKTQVPVVQGTTYCLVCLLACLARTCVLIFCPVFFAANVALVNEDIDPNYKNKLAESMGDWFMGATHFMDYCVFLSYFLLWAKVAFHDIDPNPKYYTMLKIAAIPLVIMAIFVDFGLYRLSRKLKGMNIVDLESPPWNISFSAAFVAMNILWSSVCIISGIVFQIRMHKRASTTINPTVRRSQTLVRVTHFFSYCM